MITTLTQAPMYCRDCDNARTWIRQPTRDIKSDTGKLLYEAYRCRACGAKTIVKTKDYCPDV